MKQLAVVLLMSLSAVACADEDAKSSNSVAQVESTHQQGEKLHNEKCTSCHRDEVYTREDRMVKTMSALENQVQNCMKGAAKAEWTEAQTTSVIDFLNERYYKF